MENFELLADLTIKILDRCLIFGGVIYVGIITTRILRNLVPKFLDVKVNIRGQQVNLRLEEAKDNILQLKFVSDDDQRARLLNAVLKNLLSAQQLSIFDDCDDEAQNTDRFKYWFSESSNRFSPSCLNDTTTKRKKEASDD